MKKYDVIVVGGGFAGVCAAIGAARCGATVLLVEKSGALGGAANNCLINPFMPNKTKINGVETELSQGIFAEIKSALIARNGLKGKTFDEEVLKNLLSDMLDESGVDLLLHAYLTRAKMSGGVVEEIVFATIGGEIALKADYYVDATGDAQLAFLAGFKTQLGREKDNLCQPMTLCFRVGGVKVEDFFADKNRLNDLYKRLRAEGKINNPREDILVFRTLHDGILHFNTTRVVKLDPTDPFAVPKAEKAARAQVVEMFEFLKANSDSMKDAYILSTAAEIGVRESRMIEGEYVLTKEDCLAFTLFDDSIAVSNYDIDIHNPEGSGTSHYYFPEGKYFTVPYRCLIPRGSKNLLVAGRCVSSDHDAQASYRIMPIVACIGQGAGTAIALAARDGLNVKDINIDILKETLIKNGAFLG